MTATANIHNVKTGDTVTMNKGYRTDTMKVQGAYENAVWFERHGVMRWSEFNNLISNGAVITKAA